MICRKCNEEIVGLWLPERQEHVACPTPRTIARRRLWARARKILESKLS